MLCKILPFLVVQGKYLDLLLVPLPRGAFCPIEQCVSGQWIHGPTAVDEWNSFNLLSPLAAPSPWLTVVGRTKAQLLCNSAFWTTSRGTTNKPFCHGSFK